MNKKLLFGFVAVYVLLQGLDYLIHGVILSPIYSSDALKHIWRPDMGSKMWMFPFTGLFFSFFFTLIFSKGYEGKGIAEGVRYGLYVSLMVNIPAAYRSYALYPFPYSLSLQWFLYGTLELIIAGVVLAMIYGMKPKEAAAS
ncbi:MAG TPA: hypothetical protein VNN76_09775 [Bacteroidota bacterium]|nr:hypothetical protein [Bacteroidota bacterium]